MREAGKEYYKAELKITIIGAIILFVFVFILNLIFL